jgi:hypothetical protein
VTNEQTSGVVIAGFTLIFLLVFLRQLWSLYRPNVPRSLYEKDRRFSRRAVGVLFAFLVFMTSFGGFGRSTEQPWDDAWALHWQHGPSDWIVFSLAAAIVLAGITALMVLPDTERGEQLSKNRRGTRLLKQRHADMRTVLRKDLPDLPPELTERAVLWPFGLTLASSAALRAALAGKPIHLARPMPIRRRQLSRFSPGGQRLENRSFLIETFRDTAVHEAGHAIAHHALGVDVFAIQVFGIGLGETTAEHPDALDYEPERWAWCRLVGSIAGQVAETHGKTTLFADASRADWGTISAPANLLFASEARLDGARPADGPTAWIAAAHAEAVAIVTANQDAINRIADSLEAARFDNRDAAGLGPRALHELLQGVTPRSVERVQRQDYRLH